MTTKRATPQVVVALLVIGAACVSVRTSFRHNRPPPVAGDSTWQLTYEASLHARKGGAKLHAIPPENTRHCRVFQETVVDSEMTAEARRMKHPGRDIVLKAPKAGQYQFKAQFDLHLSEKGEWRADHHDTTPTATDRDHCLRDEKRIQVSHPTVTETLTRLSEDLGSKDELFERLFEYCSSIAPGDERAPEDAAGALEKNVARPLGRARALVALCRAGKIPARLVTGFELRIGGNVRPHTWVEVLNDNRWDPYDPEYGFEREMPHRFLPVRRDAVNPIWATDSTGVSVKYTIVRIPPPPGMFDISPRNPLQILDLTRLPARLHAPLRIILLLPLGAFVTALFRTVVGVRTFGTFTPTLLALAFLYNDWQTGLIVFLSVLVVGLVSRTLLDRLKLLLVPRLGILLTLVVLCMVFGVAILHYFDWTPPGEAVLLPMVILTMLIERFYVTTEEDSMRFALQLLAGTVMLAFIVYLLLGWKMIGQMMLHYPELHCFTVAALILVGRYTGYRLTELWRFRDVVGPRDLQDNNLGPKS